jgi:O-antigen/teichoic acid export membrane protein
MIFSIILSPVWTAVTDAYIKCDFIWMKKTIKRLNILSLFFTLVVIIMLIFSPWILKLWLGDKVIISFDLSIIMAIYTVMQLWAAPYSYFINGIGKIKLTMSLTFICIVIYFLFIFLFYNIFTSSISVVIAVIGTSLISYIIQPIQIHKLLNKTATGIWNK